MTTETSEPPAVATRSRFAAKFADASERNDSLLCVGLDPDRSRIPNGIPTRDFLHTIVEADGGHRLLLQAEHRLL